VESIIEKIYLKKCDGDVSASTEAQRIDFCEEIN
jgi:hypothetical protein